ncbi:Serine/threonine-protein kinase rio2 [Echinococcus granulosus]|uniref:non-specific serine/threonine protein kinase n=2 Tax=Echinococcus granulosus TaxID=6210 RepID=A0A068WFS0_ECHGR|nr:Serine/threonine-protein kinase rio2 [Echinococcus granulosus]CDS16460.1 serine:threonine protein kinase rio2 [Echinococcus granulosus]
MPKSIKIDQFRYMTNESWRVLMAVEMGMKNHEFVPLDLVHKISRCARRGSAFLKLLRDDLVPHGLLAYEGDSRKGYSGYRLTNLGYDYLALHTLTKSGQVIDLGSMIGAGKESDVYLAVAGDMCGRQGNDMSESTREVGDQQIWPHLPSKGDYIVIKFHRLGRTSFRKVREKREYYQHRNTCSWLYLDRLAAKREFEMMRILYHHGLPVPCPLANNRNAVVMSFLADTVPLCKVLPTTLRADDAILASALYTQAADILSTITRNGLIHGDFNEFNLLVHGLVKNDGEEVETDATITTKIAIEAKLILIDFPQMISRDHRTAQETYERDLNGIVNFFSRFLEIPPTDVPPRSLADVPRTGNMDVELKAPGYPNQKPQKKTESGLRRGRIDDSELLVGTVAALALSSDDDSASETDTNEEQDVSDEDIHDSEEALTSHISQTSQSDEGEGNEDEFVKENTTINTSFVKGRKATSPMVISREEVRERRKREGRKRIQNEFRLRIKRQQRASVKSKGRAEIAAETRLFIQ